MMENNILLLTDSYKLTHWKQYPKGTEIVYSYLESRGGEFNETVFFGLQYIIEKYLAGPVVTMEKIDEAEALVAAHLGDKKLFNREGWEYILNHYDGYLPIEIRAVPEGSIVGVHNVLVTVQNTDPKCYWLTNYIETLLVEVWYPITVATLSHKIKETILSYLEATGDPNLIDFKLHDFGFRGVSSVESAGIGGCAHLVNFKGTDTLAAITVAKNYYDCDMAGFSIPASEHSTITSWGRKNEWKAMKNMLVQYPKGLVACVSDSFNIFHACANIWGKKLKKDVLAREGTLVVRPDSGDPKSVVMECLYLLGEAFGYTINEKGCKVLNNHVRLIQGDGVNLKTINYILYSMEFAGWSADNIAFGCGGALLQSLNRDTQKFAFKCSAIKINGKWQDVYKEPLTDKGKNSKRGRLKLIKDNIGYKTVPYEYLGFRDELQTVFYNGLTFNHTTLDEVRARANQ